jgi:hypothetical protein
MKPDRPEVRGGRRLTEVSSGVEPRRALRDQLGGKDSNPQ